ncbi:MAG: tetratricopeptide repeat protein [Planctomycetaceae bacterium]
MQSVRIVVIVGLLVVATLAVHGQTAGFDPLTFERTAFEYVNIDDPGYLFDHPHVVTGLTRENVGWAFRATYFSNWHPLTWLSYMLDAELYKPDPRLGIHQTARGFHATNVAWHLGSVLLLFWVLRALSGADWRSAAVAGLFAVHPIHVESVAWISERKDVLSVFFGLAAIAAYVRYAARAGSARQRGDEDSQARRSSKWLWYAVALVAYAASLMSKQMLVTLPFVLLLLDWWPLRRIAGWSQARGSDAADSLPAETAPAAIPRSRRDRKRRSQRDTATRRPPTAAWDGTQSAMRIVVEKLPFLALSLAACVIAVIAQRGALQTFEQHPPLVRVLNAILSYGLYLKKLFWPTKLAVYYPHPGDSISLASVAVAGVLLVAVTAACWRFRARHPYLLVGWLWFLGTLVPVIGLIQVGKQQMADRYAYFPAVGVYLAVVWLAGWLVEAALESPRESLRFLNLPMAVGGAAVFLVLIGLGWLQAGHWENTETLFLHAIQVTERNEYEHLNIASYYDDQAAISLRKNQPADARVFLALAIRHNEIALQIDPKFYDGHYNLGTVRLRRGRHFLNLSTNPRDVEHARNDLQDALICFQRAEELHPDTRNQAAAKLYVNWGAAWLEFAEAGGTTSDEAQRRAKKLFEQALAIIPAFSDAHRNLGRIFLDMREPDQALHHFGQFWRSYPEEADPLENSAVHRRLVIEYLRQNRRADALRHARRARELDPSLPDPETLMRSGAAF